jgi:hypothetical protein
MRTFTFDTRRAATAWLVALAWSALLAGGSAYAAEDCASSARQLRSAQQRESKLQAELRRLLVRVKAGAVSPAITSIERRLAKLGSERDALLRKTRGCKVAKRAKKPKKTSLRPAPRAVVAIAKVKPAAVAVPVTPVRVQPSLEPCRGDMRVAAQAGVGSLIKPRPGIARFNERMKRHAEVRRAAEWSASTPRCQPNAAHW